jgi:hypothetical protein
MLVSPTTSTQYTVTVTAGCYGSSGSYHVAVGGDHNGDGEINTQDLTALAASLFNGPVQCQDLDGSGTADAADLAAWIERNSAGW